MYLLLAFGFVFWPWAMAVISGIFWFFSLPAFFLWSPERMLFALLWPFGALPTWLFLTSLHDHFFEREK